MVASSLYPFLLLIFLLICLECMRHFVRFCLNLYGWNRCLKFWLIIRRGYLHRNQRTLRWVYCSFDCSSKQNTRLRYLQLPPTPKPCCLAGCTSCVWVEYAHKIADLLNGYDEKAKEIILNEVPDPVLRSFLKVELKSIQQQRERENFDDWKGSSCF